jgi:hypothetical protein
MTNKIIVLTAAAVIAFAVPSFSAGNALAASPSGSCSAGVRTVGGVTERTFCGPAAVSVSVNGKRYKLSQGSCVATSTYITVNIGVWTTQRTGRKPNYFGLDVGAVPGTSSPPARKDGTYKAGITLAFNYGGGSYAVDSLVSPATATLQADRTRGTVTGKTITGQRLTATFHC